MNRFRRLVAVRGWKRFMQALPAAAVTMLALLRGRRWVPIAAEWVVNRTWSEKLRKDLVWGLENERVGQSRYVAFLLTLALVAAMVGAYVLIDRLLARFRLWWVRIPLAAFLAFRAVKLAYASSTFIGHYTLGLIVAGAVALAPGYEGGERRPAPLTARAISSIVMGAETLAFAWGVWITISPAEGPLTLGLVLLAVSAGAWRIGRSQGGPNTDRALYLDALTGMPFMLTPLLGLLREPSPWWLCVLLGIGGLMRHALPRGAASRTSLPNAFATVLAPWTVAAIFIVPLKFRDLPDADWKNHEGQHLGWINSALFGKFLWADAGFIYSPLREYMITAFAWVTGVTLEHVRIAHILLNLAGLAVFLEIGRRVTRGRPWLQAWLMYLLLTHSPVMFFLDYRNNLSFGWADLARPAFACLAVVGASEVLGQLPAGAVPGRRDLRRLVLWGVGTGLATLYSHDFGLCAVGSVVLAVLLDRLFRHGRCALRDRLRGAIACGAAYGAGLVAVLGLFIAAYAVFGRAGELITFLVETVPRMASGVYGALADPFTAKSFLSADELMVEVVGGLPRLSFIAPLGYCVLGAAYLAVATLRRRWTARSTLLLAVFLYSVTSLRHALTRSDSWHLMNGSAGPDVLLIAIAADVARYAPRLSWRRLRIPVGGLIVAATALLGLRFSEGRRYALKERVLAVIHGDEAPSTGPAYDYPDVPRAGDMNVPKDTLAVVRHIRQNTRRRDPIFVRINSLGGEEIYFLSERPNPTRYDVIAEILTHDMQREAFMDIVRDPPVFIVGDFPQLGEEADTYIQAHWSKVEGSFGAVGPVVKYQPLP